MLLNPQVFGKEHLIFLALVIIIGGGSLVLAGLKFKSEKSQWIYMRVLASLVLLFNILTRVGIMINYSSKGWILDSYCSLTSFLLPLIVLFGKKDLKVYQGLWYLGFAGGLGTTIYPGYIGQGATIFHLNTIMGLLHHATIFILCIAMWMLKVFRPKLKTTHYFPMVISLYITVGVLEMQLFNVEDPMAIVNPLISGTPMYAWFILIVGTALVYLFAFLYEYIPKWARIIKEKKTAKNG